MINTNAYKELKALYAKIKNNSLVTLFKNDNARAAKFSREWQGLCVDFSKNNIDHEVFTSLISLAHEANLDLAIKEMFAGSKINNTENRAVLHTALRNVKFAPNGEVVALSSIMVDGYNVMDGICHVLNKMREFSSKVHNGTHLGFSGKKITDIVNIGIGGSDLGPVLVCEALKPYKVGGVDVHFVSSVDGYQIFDLLNSLNVETTLFVIASKTFTTQETMTNANTARDWFLAQTQNNHAAIKQHFIACSTNAKAVSQFGIDTKHMFEFWDFVGGRYSLWSAIGMPIVLYIGFANFMELLRGANAMDNHFATTHDYENNLPVILALISIWYINFYNYSTQVILPYNTRLASLPAYLQQLQMESNGKHVSKNGENLNYHTCPVIWGSSGINGQHAYFQHLHQGTAIHPLDFIVAKSAKFSNEKHNNILLANVLAQAEAFMCGKAKSDAYNELVASGVDTNMAAELAPHKTFTGDRPSNMIILPEIDPYYLGALVALYEHKTFVEGVVWQINSFDQWGVELGKKLATNILADVSCNKISLHDQSTSSLMAQIWKL